MNPNDAELARVTIANSSGQTDQTPITQGGNQFQVIVEGEAGSVLGASSRPYTVTITALDITNGTNPGPPFTQQDSATYTAPNWPFYKHTFTVTIPNVGNVNGHLFKYYAVLVSPNQVDSFVESPLFLLQQ